MLEGWEWLIIGIVAIVIIMWGPAKIPEFARSLGRAKGEFTKAQKEFENTAAATVSSTVSGGTTAAPGQTPLRSRDEVLVETARNLGIDPTGKTREQVAEEISVRLKIIAS